MDFYWLGYRGDFTVQAHTQGGQGRGGRAGGAGQGGQGGGFHQTPLSADVIHMNLYGTCVSHTPLIESRTPLCRSRTFPLSLRLGIGLL